MDSINSTAQGLHKLKEDYRQRLPGRLEAVRAEWQRILLTGWDEAFARQIHSECHQLAGTGKTFGFPDISRIARLIVEEFARQFDDGSPPERPRLQELGGLIDELMKGGTAAEHPRARVPETGRVTTLQRATSTRTKANKDDTPTIEPLSSLPIYIVEDDHSLADHIVMELSLRGYDARAVYDLEELETEVARSGLPPGAIVMDVIFPGAITGGIDLINRFHADQILKAPVVFMSANDSFTTRLEIVRAGGDAFFVKPFDINLLVEKLETLVGETNPEPLRILIVDDEPMITDMVCLLLGSAGLDARGINDPTQTVDEVLSFQPDLVILDLHMPVVDGMEVARVLRQHESCTELPLLFLSAESDPKIRARALNIGVDDFLVKPVDRHYLISAVANRAQRARAVAAKIYRDSLTQLLVHDEIKNQLADQLSTARRQSRELSYSILDLDKFKNINDTYGHLTGDQVIKSLANLLRRSFRRSDILGRYGGEEFVVIMPDTGLVDAVIVMDRVRHEFSLIKHHSEIDGQGFSTSFSAGVCSFPDFTESEDLILNADKALYEAKETGRNRICMAESISSPAEQDTAVGG